MIQKAQLVASVLQTLFAAIGFIEVSTDITYKIIINNIVKSHQKQTNDILKIHQSFQKIKMMKQTANQLNISITKVGQEWTQLVKAIDQNINFCEAIKARYDEEKLPDSQIMWKDSVALPFTFLLAGCYGYLMISKKRSYVQYAVQLWKSTQQRRLAIGARFLMRNTAVVPVEHDRNIYLERQPISNEIRAASNPENNLQIDGANQIQTRSEIHSNQSAPVQQLLSPHTVLPISQQIVSLIQIEQGKPQLDQASSNNKEQKGNGEGQEGQKGNGEGQKGQKGNGEGQKGNGEVVNQEPVQPVSVISPRIKCVQIGVRGISLIVAGFGIVYEGQSINNYRRQLDKLKKYYSNINDFTYASVQRNIITAVIQFSTNLYQLILVSKYALNDLANMLIIKGMMTPYLFQQHYKLGVQISAVSMGINQAYIDKYRQFSNKIREISSNGEKFPQQIGKISECFQKFLKDNNVQDKIKNIAEMVQNCLKKYSIGSVAINLQTQKQRTFLKQAAKILATRKDTMNQKNFTLNEELLKENDQFYLKSILKAYSSQISLQTISQQTKQILFHTIVTFSDNFYYDDPTGQSIFKFKFSEAKDMQTFKELYDTGDEKDQNYNDSKKYKFSLKDSNLQEDKRIVYVQQIRKLKNQPNLQVQPIFRYLRYKTFQENKNPNFIPKDQVKREEYLKKKDHIFIPYEGMKFSLPKKNNQVGYIEKNLYEGTYEILEKIKK